MFENNSIWNDFKYNVIQNGNTLTYLILINVIVFVLINLLKVILVLMQVNVGLYNAIWSLLAISAYPTEVLTKPWTIFTYMFVHSGFFHIFFNMLIFYWFGRIFREFLGDKKLLSTFMVGGLAGAAVFLIAYQIIPLLINSKPMLGMVGASAGVLAVLVAIATLLPDYTMHLLFFGGVKLKYIALVLVIIDLLSLAGSNAGGHFAHIGGALYGFIYIKQLNKGNDIGKWFTDAWDGVVNFFKSIGKKRSASNFRVHRSDTVSRPKNVNQNEIDRILDKIAESGYDSLSEDEKDTLFKASKD